MPELSQEKIFKYLTAFLALLAAGLLVREIFFKPKPLAIPEIVFPLPEIKINTDVFEEFKIGELTPFEGVVLPELIGREKPFEQYSLQEYQAALAALQSTSTATSTEVVATTTEEIATTTEETATTTIE